MNRRSILTLSTAAVLCLCAFSSSRADETSKYRAVMHGAAQSQDVGDVDSRTIVLVRFSGITEFPNGTTGTGYFVGVGDHTKGAGPAFTYTNVTFDDGSALWFKQTQTTKIEGAESLFQGTVIVLAGKGRFEGAKGDGTFTGVRTVPLASGADLYFDYAINVKR
jgi:hypothetical protein